MNGALLGAAVSILVVLLSLIIYLLLRMDKKLDSKQDKEVCTTRLQNCEKVFDLENFWLEFNKHSHTGLPNGSKVTR